MTGQYVPTVGSVLQGAGFSRSDLRAFFKPQKKASPEESDYVSRRAEWLRERGWEWMI